VTDSLNSLALISDDEDLVIALEECFKLHKKFKLFKYNSNIINSPIDININIDALLVSEEIIKILQDMPNINKWWDKYLQNLIILTLKDKDEISLGDLELEPRHIIKLPLSFNSTLQLLDSIIRENHQRMIDIKIDNLNLDTKSKQISLDKKVEKLTEKETEILWRLLSNKNSKILQKNLLMDIWGYDEDIETRTLETHIYRIRKKLNLIGAKNIEIKNTENSYILIINNT